MLTENELQRLARLIRLAEYMTQDQREGLMKLVRDLKAAEATGSVMPPSAIQDLVSAVGDQQVRDIVNDLRSAGRTEPGGFLGPSKPETREPRRAKDIPLEPPSGIPWCDQMMDAQDALDRAERIKGFGSALFRGQRR